MSSQSFLKVFVFKCCALLCAVSFAQNIKNEKVEVKFLLPPATPLREDATKYRVTVDIISLPFGYSHEGLVYELKYYAKLHGEKYQHVESGADIEINVRVDRFIAETPRFETRNVTTEKSDKTKVTTTVYTGYTLVAVPMFVRIRDLKEDRIVFEDYINASNQLTEIKTEGHRTSKDANDHLQREVRIAHDKFLKNNKAGFATLMQQRFSFYSSVYYWAINYVETSKKGNYDDILAAKDATRNVLDSLTDKTVLISEIAKERMLKVIDQWEAILKESNIEDRKARIDKKVTLAVLENLALCNYFIYSFRYAQKYLNQAREIQKDPWQYNLEKDIADMKKRMDANRIEYD